MAIWQCDFYVVPMKGISPMDVCYGEESFLYWHKTIALSVFEQEIEKLLDQEPSWSKDIHQYGKSDGTTVQMSETDNAMAVSIRCRLDMRKPCDQLWGDLFCLFSGLRGMLYYAGKFASITRENICEMIATSPAAKFCKDPRRFLDSIRNDL